ncbi:transposase [Demequina lutea]|uniref:transposase n=1 Tax=Demequina lutea TaxID=431489 RepID=UPI000ADB7BDC
MSADGTGVVTHAGSIAVGLLTDRTGLTKDLGRAIARRSFVPVHQRGQVLVDMAVMLADGGEAIGDIHVLRHQGQVLGPVASAPTVWRALDELTPAALKRIEVVRARVRRHVWEQLPKLPTSQVGGSDLGGVVVLDVDATLVTLTIGHDLSQPSALVDIKRHKP